MEGQQQQQPHPPRVSFTRNEYSGRWAKTTDFALGFFKAEVIDVTSRTERYSWIAFRVFGQIRSILSVIVAVNFKGS